MTSSRKPRYKYYELFNVGNVKADRSVLALNSLRSHYSKGNSFFYVDSSFNLRQALYSLLRATKLLPLNTSSYIEFVDLCTIFDTLLSESKQRLLDNDYVGAHLLHYSRKRRSLVFFANLKPKDFLFHYYYIA